MFACRCCCCCCQELWYHLAFEGYPSSEAEWFPAGRILGAYPGGAALLKAFEVGRWTPSATLCCCSKLLWMHGICCSMVMAPCVNSQYVSARPRRCMVAIETLAVPSAGVPHILAEVPGVCDVLLCSSTLH